MKEQRGIPSIMLEGLARPVPVLALGTMSFSPHNREQVFEILDAYTAAGGDALETASIYGHGNSERVLGLWMRERHNRAMVTLMTKGCHPGPEGPRVAPEAFRSDFRESLDRLMTDRVDLYMLHRDDESRPVAPIMEALNEEISRGRITSIGASNWTASRIREANSYARQRSLVPFGVSSINMSLAQSFKPIWDGCLQMDGETMRWHESSRFPLLAWSAQARGLFNDRYARGEPWRPDLKELYDTPLNHERMRRARLLAEKTGTSANQVALAWVLRQAFPVSAIVGPRTLTQLLDSLGVLKLSLTADQLRSLTRD